MHLIDAPLELGHVRHMPFLGALDLEQTLGGHLQPVLAVALLHQCLLSWCKNIVNGWAFFPLGGYSSTRAVILRAIILRATLGSNCAGFYCFLLPACCAVTWALECRPLCAHSSSCTNTINKRHAVTSFMFVQQAALL